MTQDKALNPVRIRLLGALGMTLAADVITNLVE